MNSLPLNKPSKSPYNHNLSSVPGAGLEPDSPHRSHLNIPVRSIYPPNTSALEANDQMPSFLIYLWLQ